MIEKGGGKGCSEGRVEEVKWKEGRKLRGTRNTPTQTDRHGKRGKDRDRQRRISLPRSTH